MYRLAIVTTLLCLVACRSQKAHQVATWPPLKPLQNEGSLRVWINTYDPISYIFERNGDSLALVIYTHKYKSNLLVQKRISFSKDLPDGFFEKSGLFTLKTCDKYEGYSCFGLDGD